MSPSNDDRRFRPVTDPVLAPVIGLLLLVRRRFPFAVLGLTLLGAVVAAVPPADAKRIADRLEIHYTSKQGSWLNMAEIELSVRQRQCLGQCFADRCAMEHAVTAWVATRNAATRRIAWQFTTTDARTKSDGSTPPMRIDGPLALNCMGV